jgi:hypothetical protein
MVTSVTGTSGHGVTSQKVRVSPMWRIVTRVGRRIKASTCHQLLHMLVRERILQSAALWYEEASTVWRPLSPKVLNYSSSIFQVCSRSNTQKTLHFLEAACKDMDRTSLFGPGHSGRTGSSWNLIGKCTRSSELLTELNKISLNFRLFSFMDFILCYVCVNTLNDFITTTAVFL